MAAQTTPLTAPRPSFAQTVQAVRLVADELDLAVCWLHEGRFHFELADGFTIAISAESGERFRLDACRRGRPAASLFALANDEARLAALVRRLSVDLLALV